MELKAKIYVAGNRGLIDHPLFEKLVVKGLFQLFTIIVKSWILFLSESCSIFKMYEHFPFYLADLRKGYEIEGINIM